jgi:hypothetical protein
MSEAVLKNVYASLDMMWRGMLGLFVVCGVIAVLMILISKYVRAKPRDSA